MAKKDKKKCDKPVQQKPQCSQTQQKPKEEDEE